ncbi:LysE family translocator [Asticcacaulis sp.]|uniref:LysE family translocator n=1 Tax=Asticcacaulis sp. TaxID=1872648 RepID=UPI002C6C9C83|nr:LysE family translocator [Asticcacaulis sp.]HTM80119.1 LysE family translocator [Asticcacaulis sp.]
MFSLIDPHTYWAFFVTMFFMAITPGPANLYAIRTGLGRLKRNVIAAVIGLNCASLIWFIACAFGLQVLLTAFPLLFQMVAVAGGLYLGWMAVKGFRSALDINNENISSSLTALPDPDKTTSATFREGFMVQLLNPKVTLFFTAVLPPFVDIHRAVPPQMVAFAATAIGMDTITMTGYGLAAVTLSHVLADPRNKQLFDLGVCLILMGIAAIIIWHAAMELLRL